MKRFLFSIITLLIGVFLFASISIAEENVSRQGKRKVSSAKSHQMRVNLKTHKGFYLVAEKGGGGTVLAKFKKAHKWATFTLIDINGGKLMSGDRVRFMSYSRKHYLVAEGGGGREVKANRTKATQWETFTIRRISGSGKIKFGDTVSIQAHSRQFMGAEGGGGGAINANRSKIGIWEKFVLMKSVTSAVRKSMTVKKAKKVSSVTGKRKSKPGGSVADAPAEIPISTTEKAFVNNRQNVEGTAINRYPPTTRSKKVSSATGKRTHPQRNVKMDRKGTARLMSSLPAKKRVAFKAIGRTMAKQLAYYLKNKKGGSRLKKIDREIIAKGMRKITTITSPKNKKDLFTHTKLAVYNGLQENLHKLSNKVININKIKAILREEISMLKDVLSSWPENVQHQKITYRTCSKQRDGRYKVIERTEALTKESAKYLIKKMEDQLAGLRHSSKKNKIALQEAMNKQAQLMQMMSNIQKVMNDTAMAIINNLK